MLEVIVIYDLGSPPVPRDFAVLLPGSGYPKANYKIVGHAETQKEGLEVGQKAFDAELEALSWLLNDSVLYQLEADEKSDRKDIYRWHDQMEAEYEQRLAAHRNEYEEKIHARRAELIAAHEKEADND